MEFNIMKKRKRKTFWFEHNRDAEGYQYGDNRITDPQISKERVRRTWNI